MDLLDDYEKLVDENARLRMENARLMVGADREALSGREAARFIGVSRRKLTSLKNRGVIPYALIDEGTVFPVEGLRRFVRDHTVGA